MPKTPHDKPPEDDNSSKNPQDEANFDAQITELATELDSLRTQLANKEEQLLRSIADLQNVRRRANEDRIRLPQLGTENILQTLLPCLDTIELALKNKPTEVTDWSRGVETILSSLLTTLQAQGVERIDQIGVPIDPEIHEVITIDGEGAETVVEILQTGYRLHNKVLRAARVRGGQA